jgi:hypothetical protein
MRTFVDEAPGVPPVTLNGLPVQGEARATADVLYIKRGVEAPEVFEDLVTSERLTGAQVQKALQGAQRTAELARVDLVAGKPSAAAKLLVESSGIHDPEVLELVGQVQDADAVQGYLRAQEKLAPPLRDRLSLVREKNALHTRFETAGMRWREVPVAERDALLATGQVYVEEAGPLKSMDAALTPGRSLSRPMTTERVVYEELEDPITQPLMEPSARLRPTQLSEAGRTYSWRGPAAAGNANGGGRARSRQQTGVAAPSPRVFRLRLADRAPEQQLAPQRAVPCAL